MTELLLHLPQTANSLIMIYIVECILHIAAFQLEMTTQTLVYYCPMTTIHLLHSDRQFMVKWFLVFMRTLHRLPPLQALPS